MKTFFITLAALSLTLMTVSYTNLTMPTNSLV